MKEREMQRQLWERERALDRKLQITALEKDLLRSQSTNVHDKLPFNWTLKKERNVPELAHTMSKIKSDQKPALMSALNGLKIGIFQGILTLRTVHQMLKIGMLCTK